MRTACLIKPDAYPKYVPLILERLFEKNFEIEHAGVFTFDQLMLDQWYHEHIGKPYYENLCEFMQSGPVLGMILKREFAIETLRQLMGPAKISDRVPGQIRYDIGDPERTERNCIHGSDSTASANIEIDLLEVFLNVCWHGRHR